jgi:hypothetical protein
LSSLYEDLVAHRHRQLLAVARLVGGVQETRYQAGRGGAPFEPVPAPRAREAVKFLCEHAFASPGRLLDADVLLRIAPEGTADVLQGSNLKLLAQLLDPSVFQRLAEAQTLRAGRDAYLGLDLLSDLNGALFAELSGAQVEIGLYRRDIQRNYVTLLVSLFQEKAEERKPAHKPGYRPPDQLPELRREPLVVGALSSELGTAGREARLARGRPSEFRAALRSAAQALSRRIELAQSKARDRATAAHLTDLLKELGTIL